MLKESKQTAIEREPETGRHEDMKDAISAVSCASWMHVSDNGSIQTVTSYSVPLCRTLGAASRLQPRIHMVPLLSLSVIPIDGLSFFAGMMLLLCGCV